MAEEKKKVELTDEELEKVAGGVNTEAQAPKYADKTRVRFESTIFHVEVTGTIRSSKWVDAYYNQYMYEIFDDPLIDVPGIPVNYEDGLDENFVPEENIKDVIS